MNMLQANYDRDRGNNTGGEKGTWGTWTRETPAEGKGGIGESTDEDGWEGYIETALSNEEPGIYRDGDNFKQGWRGF